MRICIPILMIFLFAQHVLSQTVVDEEIAAKSPLPLQSFGSTTIKGNKLYLHVSQWPSDGKLYLGGLRSGYEKVYPLMSPSTSLPTKRISEVDIVINVPRKVRDTVNNVIVVELKTPIQTDSTRYVAANIPLTRLLAFDATQHGEGFSLGDGKANRYYVEGWKKSDQSLSWRIRTSEESRYRIIIKYLTSETSGGDYTLNVDEAYQFGYTINSEKNNNPVEQELAELTLAAGTHVISLQPGTIRKADLMKLLEIQLVPIKD